MRVGGERPPVLFGGCGALLHASSAARLSRRQSGEPRALGSQDLSPFRGRPMLLAVAQDFRGGQEQLLLADRALPGPLQSGAPRRSLHCIFRRTWAGKEGRGVGGFK